MEKYPLYFSHLMELNHKKYDVSVSVNKNGSLRIETNNVSESLYYELYLDENAVKSHDMLSFIGLETFIKIYKQKAAENKIELTEYENK